MMMHGNLRNLWKLTNRAELIIYIHKYITTTIHDEQMLVGNQVKNGGLYISIGLRVHLLEYSINCVVLTTRTVMEYSSKYKGHH